MPWQRVFQRYIGQALSKDDFSWGRPNRRYISEDLFLPELKSYKIGKVVVAVDTSGSITKENIEEFSAELNKINHLVDEVTAISCDCRVHEVVKLTSFKQFLSGKFQFKGGGGTAFEPVFDRVKELGASPELLIYLTDGWGSFPEKKPSYPVIWVLTRGGNAAPWGKNIDLPSAQEDNARI